MRHLVSAIIGVPALGALVIVLTALASWSAVVLADVVDDRASSHYAGVLVLEAGLLGAIASLNVVWFVLFWGVAVSAASRLLTVWGGGASNAVTRRFTRYVSLATAAMRQSPLGRFVAYASVAQVSLLLLSSTTLTPLGLTATVVQVVSHTTMMMVLAVTLSGAASPLARLTIGVGLAVVAVFAIYPVPVLDRIETSVARVILRVSPHLASEVADCLTASQAPPPPSEIPGLPAGALMAAPCETGKR